MGGTYDLAVIGMGPRGLSLLTLLHDDPRYEPFKEWRVLGIDKDKPANTWSERKMPKKMYLRGNFLKDIVLLEMPESPHSILKFLKESGNLHVLVNKFKGARLNRRQFHDYLLWVAKDLPYEILTSQEAKSIVPKFVGGKLNCFEIVCQENVYVTKRVVLATNDSEHSAPMDFFESGALTPEEYYGGKSEIKKMGLDFCVIGGGQTSGEVALDILTTFPDSRVTLAMKSQFPKHTAINSFTEETLTSSQIEAFYDATEENKKNIQESLKSIGFPREAMSEWLLEKLYEEFKEGKLKIRNRFEASTIESRGGKKIVKSNEGLALEADVVIAATGYRTKYPDYLKPLGDYMDSDQAGNLKVSRRFRLLLNCDSDPGVGMWVTGGFAEKTHGPLVQLVFSSAWNSRQILDDIMDGGGA